MAPTTRDPKPFKWIVGSNRTFLARLLTRLEGANQISRTDRIRYEREFLLEDFARSGRPALAGVVAIEIRADAPADSAAREVRRLLDRRRKTPTRSKGGRPAKAHPGFTQAAMDEYLPRIAAAWKEIQATHSASARRTSVLAALGWATDDWDAAVRRRVHAAMETRSARNRPELMLRSLLAAVEDVNARTISRATRRTKPAE